MRCRLQYLLVRDYDPVEDYSKSISIRFPWEDALRANGLHFLNASPKVTEEHPFSVVGVV